MKRKSLRRFSAHKRHHFGTTMYHGRIRKWYVQSSRHFTWHVPVPRPDRDRRGRSEWATITTPYEVLVRTKREGPGWDQHVVSFGSRTTKWRSDLKVLVPMPGRLPASARTVSKATPQNVFLHRLVAKVCTKVGRIMTLQEFKKYHVDHCGPWRSLKLGAVRIKLRAEHVRDEKRRRASQKRA